MKLLTQKLRQQLPPLYSQEDKAGEAVAIVKFFTPDSNWTWYATEFDGDDLFFGLFDGLEKGLGYFSLSELQSAHGPMGLAIARDRWWEPKKLQEFIGQPKITGALERITSRPDWDRDAFWIQGPSGTGKTSLAWIVANQVANDFDIAELDGDKCSVQAVREIEKNIGLCPMFGGWKAYIINEAHAMTKQAIQAWLTLLEKLPAKRLIVFTTTEPLQENLFGSFSGPFGRRCKVFTFTNQSLAKDFATRARQIAQDENLDGKPLHAYVRLVQDCHNNMGMVLQRIEQGDMLP